VWARAEEHGRLVNFDRGGEPTADGAFGQQSECERGGEDKGAKGAFHAFTILLPSSTHHGVLPGHAALAYVEE
jgi:hypothetical protein